MVLKLKTPILHFNRPRVARKGQNREGADVVVASALFVAVRYTRRRESGLPEGLQYGIDALTEGSFADCYTK
jgi:hypothetical protein